MKADRAGSDGGGAFQFLRETGRGAVPLGFVRAGRVEDICRVDQHVLRRDAGLGQGIAEARGTLLANTRPVAVIFGDSGEELHGRHPRVVRAEDGLMDAAGIACMSAEIARHGRPLRGSCRAKGSPFAGRGTPKRKEVPMNQRNLISPPGPGDLGSGSFPAHRRQQGPHGIRLVDLPRP
jgi:hypothetical protein